MAIMQINYKRYLAYLFRWQLSTPILYFVIVWMAAYDNLTATIVANLIGGLIFFWVDQYIFTSKALSAQWEVKDNVKCSDCGKTARGYRIVKTGNYDKSEDPAPKFRCEDCSAKKTAELKKKGIKV
jgi:DNA-directed RNA polymerase subunit RPC12/RpoP